jgi:AraC family transcriptional regulator
MDVEITHMPELRVATVRHVGPYEEIPEAFERLHQIADEAGLASMPGTTTLAIYHDDPSTTPSEDLRSDAAVVVPPQEPLPRGLVAQTIPEGDYARTEHVGPYERLGEVWEQFKQSIPQSGKRPGSGPSFEIYRNDPTTVPKEALVTDLYMSIA